MKKYKYAIAIIAVFDDWKSQSFTQMHTPTQILKLNIVEIYFLSYSVTTNYRFVNR